MNRYILAFFILSLAACNADTKQESAENNKKTIPANAVSDLAKKGYKGKIKTITIENLPNEDEPSAIRLSTIESYNEQGYLTEMLLDAFDPALNAKYAYKDEYFYENNILKSVRTSSSSNEEPFDIMTSKEYIWLTPFSYQTWNYYHRNGKYDTSDREKTEFFLDNKYYIVKQITYFGNDSSKVRDVYTNAYNTDYSIDTSRLAGKVESIDVIDQYRKDGNPGTVISYSHKGTKTLYIYTYEFY